MKRTIISITAAAAMLAAYAEIPEGYYQSLEGLQGDALKSAIKELSASHVRITYNTKTWQAFETTDVRLVNGREAWWDMYSNNIVYLPAHDALNIEHSVANSWWGGKSGSNDAYSDLFHLNPSDQNANNKKGSYPPGEVSDARLLDNGLLRIGTPVEGQGGEASSVFEPADEYKGDFARAFMYVFTAYAGLEWKPEYAYMYDDNGQLLPWAADVLLRWHRADPVDDKEINRNEAIYTLQHNRNPFIDHPDLAEYVWGANSGEAYSVTAPAEAMNRPEAPVFSGSRLTGVNTYTRRWWDGFALRAEHGEGTLMLSVDGGEYSEWDGEAEIAVASDMDDVHTYRAYVKAPAGDRELRSSIATLTLTPLDPTETNYSFARWERIDDNADLEDGSFYLLLSANTLHAMSTDGGVATKGFMESAGFVEFDNEGRVTEIPAEAAVVRLENAGSGKHRLAVCDTRGRYIGSWNATAKNQMRLIEEEYTPATAAFGANGSFLFTFDTFGSLQFNKTQPRFLNYESSQSPVYLYKFLDFGGGPQSGLSLPAQETPWAVGVDGRDILADGETCVFDLGGRRVESRGLAPGIYIVTGRGKTHKVLIK